MCLRVPEGGCLSESGTQFVSIARSGNKHDSLDWPLVSRMCLPLRYNVLVTGQIVMASNGSGFVLFSWLCVGYLVPFKRTESTLSHTTPRTSVCLCDWMSNALIMSCMPLSLCAGGGYAVFPPACCLRPSRKKQPCRLGCR